jgi:hypothetical protein
MINSQNSLKDGGKEKEEGTRERESGEEERLKR